MRSLHNCKIDFAAAEEMHRVTQQMSGDDDGIPAEKIIGAYLGWALDEIERKDTQISILKEKLVEARGQLFHHFGDEELDPPTADDHKFTGERETDEAVLLRRNEIINKQVAKIRELEADVLQKSILCDSIAENCNGLRNRAWKAEARIEELETGLKKERSARLLEKSGSILLAYLKENEIDFDRFFDGKAQEQLQAEGKIGTGEHIVETDQMVTNGGVWQVTEERKATLAASLKVLERLKRVNTDTDHSYLDRGIATLRAMLREAE